MQASVIEHPGIISWDANCSSCHANKTRGKSVHSAMLLSCTVCHLAQTEADMTTLNLAWPKEKICSACHQESVELQRHLPVVKGQCVDCHDTHSSSRRSLLREQADVPALSSRRTPRILPASLATVVADPPATAQSIDMPRFRWESFTTANGLPDNHVFCALVDGNRIWAGTENGLGLYENGAWKVIRPADGLAHQAVLSLAVDKRTGDLWVGTMGGLSRISAGRIDNFTQLNSGLSNNIVYGVGVQGDFVWTATAAGASRLNTRTGQWALFNERNTPMYEIWTYAVSPAEDKVYYAVWGGGVLEYDVKTERWKNYDDPDGETELVLMKDQGLIHEITTSVSYVDKILWVATYFGASRYDGRYWHNFLQKDSGLPSNFLNQIKAVDANRAWFATDKGLAYYDGTNWAVYRPALDTHKPEMLVRDATGEVKKITVQSAPAHNYILGVDFQGDDIWVATAKGLSHGIRQHDTKDTTQALREQKPLPGKSTQKK
jgi:predicted CXXCH cytochrome family protein